MTLQLSIVKSPSGINPEKLDNIFYQSGGSIGRGDGNYWVLNDPERFLSSCHCKISCENEQYFLTDMSTNGTFINGSAEPIGKGNTVALSHNDIFELGDYQLGVSLLSRDTGFATLDAAIPESAISPSNDYFKAHPGDVEINYLAQDTSASYDPFGNDNIPLSDNPLSDETGPSAVLECASQPYLNATIHPANTETFSSATHSDQANVMSQAVVWPKAVQDSALIPEDWDDNQNDETDRVIDQPLPLTDSCIDLHRQMNSASALPRTPTTANAAEQAARNELSQSKSEFDKADKREQPQHSVNSQSFTSTLDNTLIEALGLEQYDLDNQQILEIHKIVGELVQETIAGMMQVLRSRANIKNEFRMNVTTIQPVENNPLKFSVNIDEALENMFIKKSNAYKKPVEAVREGFQGIAEHQVALLAGIRSAFEGMIERFDPDNLEKQFAKQSKGAVFSKLNKVRYWSAYTHYYKSLIDNMENSFQYLFGDEFVQAYEDQLRKLTLARKNNAI